MSSHQTGIGLQADYTLMNDKRSHAQYCQVGSGLEGTISFQPVGRPAVTDTSGTDALSKLETLQAWLQQFPTNLQGLYLNYVARDPSITNLTNLSNGEINCLAQGKTCTFCYGSQEVEGKDLMPGEGLDGPCPCPASETTTVPPDLVTLAKEIMAIRSTVAKPSGGCCPRSQAYLSDSGCSNLKAFEWTTKTDLPLASPPHESFRVDSSCAAAFGLTTASVCSNFVDVMYNGSWQDACAKVTDPPDVDKFAEAICQTLVDVETLKLVPNCLGDTTDPYCQCLNATKVATYNAQASAAKCCYFAPAPPPPPAGKKSSSTTIIIIVVVVIVVLILAIAIPLGVKAKHKREAMDAAMQHGLPGGPGSPQGQPLPPYASPSPLQTNTTFDPDQRSSILPPPTTL